MKKRLIALLIVLSLLFLTSCSAINNFKDFVNDIKYIVASGNLNHDYNVDASLSYDFDESIKDQIDERFEKMDEILESGNTLRAVTFMALYAQQVSDLYYVSDQANLAFIAFSKDTSDEKASKTYEELTDLFTDYSARLTKMYRTIYESPLKDTFYSAWTKEDIEEALILSDAYGEDFTALTKEVNTEITRYQEMDQSSPDFLEDSAEAYYNIVHKNMELAKLSGFENYVDYAYKYVYGRDYTPEDGRKIYDYVRDYIVPLGRKIQIALSQYNKLSAIQKDASKLMYDSVDPQSIPETLAPYYEKLGGTFPAAFQKWQENFYTSSSSNGLSNAYTIFLRYYGEPVCFYGPDCQTLNTYVHEQGHFNAFYSSAAMIDSIDLCEVHSQGNEWLYLAYISENYNADYFKHLASYYLYDAICTIVLATCCDAFEQYVYAHPDLKASDYDDVFIEQAKEMGAYDFLKKTISIQPEEYWHYAIVSNSVYYLSYAVSKIPSIEIYVMAMEDGFESAAKRYADISTVDPTAGFVQTLIENGFGSPFDDDPYIRIRDYFGS